MLKTFDENLVITAVQQLSTDLTSLSARIKKLEDEGGGGGGFELIDTYQATINLKNDTTWDSWTPSNTETQIKATETEYRMLIDLSDIDKNSEGLLIEALEVVNYKYAENTPLVSIPISTSRQVCWLFIPSPANITEFTGNVYNTNLQGKNILWDNKNCYYTSGGTPQVQSTDFGVYAGTTIITTTLTDGKYGIKLNKIYAKCNDTYFPTSKYSSIDSEQTNMIIKINAYKIHNSPITQIYHDARSLIVLPE